MARYGRKIKNFPAASPRQPYHLGCNAAAHLAQGFAGITVMVGCAGPQDPGGAHSSIRRAPDRKFLERREMQAEQHQGKGLQYLTILPDDYEPSRSYPLVVLLHGFGANMQDLAGLTPAINRTGYVYACPNAPIPFDLGGGHTGYGWMTPRGMGTPDEAKQAENLLGGFFDEVFEQFKVTPGQAALMGFSQGGGMTYRCGLTSPDRFAGLAALSATLPDTEELGPRLPQERTQPIFVAHGTSDPMVTADRAYAARDFLEEAGYTPEFHEYNMGHEISVEVLQDLIPWLESVLPPLKPGG